MEYELRLGERAVIRRRFFGCTLSVVYAGMPAGDRYSLAVTRSMGHQASSFNVYFDTSIRRLAIDGGELRIQELSPVGIRFRYDAT